MQHKIFKIFILFLFLLTLTTTLCAENTRNPNWAKPINLPHSDNFYQIAPNLYRSAQPSAKAFKEFEKYGIKTVINLRSKHSDKDLIKGTKLNLYEIPMRAWSSKDEDVIKVLSIIKKEQKNGAVLVHCQHGADRTGLISAMYRLVFQNWTKTQAIRELKSGGYGYHSIWLNIPKYIKKVNIKYIKNNI